MAENDVILNIALYDAQGRMVRQEAVNNSHAQIDLSNQRQIVSLLKVTTNKGTQVFKLLKE